MTLVDSASSAVMLADGAMGTYGFALGQAPGPVPSLWPIERPDLVERIHAEYAHWCAAAVHVYVRGYSRLAREAG